MFHAIMARPLRLELAGALYHVTARGDGREDIYLSDADRIAWLETLAVGAVIGRVEDSLWAALYSTLALLGFKKRDAFLAILPAIVIG